MVSKKETSSPEISSKFSEIEDNYNKKQWHQVTLGLVDLVHMKDMQQGQEIMDLYSNIICEMETKINPMSLVELTSAIITQISDDKEAVMFVEKILPKVSDHKEASVFCRVLIAQLTLCRLKDVEATKEMVITTEKILDEVDGLTTTHGLFYKLQSDLYCQVGDHANFYRAALRHLACTKSPESADEQAQLAFYIGLAALLGEGIYNFGEVLAHPILECLKNTEHEWVLSLLVAFNTGDIAAFERLADKWKAQPDLLKEEMQLREKIRLLCLMEMAFKCDSMDRHLKFRAIANETGLLENEVEEVVMKALSLGLVRGSIDQLFERVQITWVQPRVLRNQQLVSMTERIDVMLDETSKMQSMLCEGARPIITV